MFSSSITPEDVLNSLAAHIAVVDRWGTVLTVNRRWEEFARENGCGDLKRVGVGSNYFAVCGSADGESSARSEEAAAGIREVIGGARDFFEMEYRCDSPTEERWFSMQVTPFGVDRGAAVVAHYNITFRKKQEFRLAEDAAEISRDSEMSSLRRFSGGSPAAQTATSYGLGPLSESAPQLFRELTDRYENLLDLAVEERIFQAGRSASDGLREIAARLGAMGGGPRDLVEIHCDALREKIERKEGVRVEKASIYQEESRILLIEAMGYLVSYYRSFRQTASVGGRNGRSLTHGR